MAEQAIVCISPSWVEGVPAGPVSDPDGSPVASEVLVCQDNRASGSHWIVEAISGLQKQRPAAAPSVGAHSTRGLEASWALYKGESGSDIFAAATTLFC